MKFFKQLFSAFTCAIIFVVLSFFCSGSLQAQVQAEKSYYSVWGGYSFNSVKFLGKTKNSQTHILALGYQKQFSNYKGKGELYYSMDIIPYLGFEYPKRDEDDRRVSRSGFGLSPIGFLWKGKSSKRIIPFAHTTGGLIFMESNFPTDLSRRLNYTFDVTLGVNLRLGRAALLSFGYKFHHISNAETGKQNPGLDSNFLFLSISTQ